MIDMDKLEEFLEEGGYSEEEKRMTRQAVAMPDFEEMATKWLNAHTSLTYLATSFAGEGLRASEIVALMYRQIQKLEMMIAEREGLKHENLSTDKKHEWMEQVGRQFGASDYERAMELKEKVIAAGGIDAYVAQQKAEIDAQEPVEEEPGPFFIPGGEG